MSQSVYKVFISSTFQDLTEERKFVIESLLAIDCMPIAMEFFPGSEQTPIDFIHKKMDECDYFLLAVKGKYGSIYKDSGKSFTELEYEYALEKNIPTLIFLHSEPQKLYVSDIDSHDTERRQKLQFFQERLQQQHTSRGWNDAEGLAKQVVISITALTQNKARPGNPGFQPAVPLPNPAPKNFNQIDIQKKKLGYIRFFQLSKQNAPGAQPLYHRYITRLKKSIPVYDEYVLYRMNEFYDDITGFVHKDSSTGVVDMNILNPWQPRLLLPEGTYERTPGELEETSYVPSNTFVTTTHYYNAFQENQYAAIKMAMNTRKATLIVDFRNIPNSTQVINAKNVKGYLKSREDKLDKRVPIQTKFPEYGKKYVHIDSLFCLNLENLKANDVIRIDFTDAINWEALQETKLMNGNSHPL